MTQIRKKYDNSTGSINNNILHYPSFDDPLQLLTAHSMALYNSLSKKM